MFQKVMIAVVLVATLGLVSGCCALFKTNCLDDGTITKAELIIFKQKAQVETDVDFIKDKLYAKKGKLTKFGTKIQSAYNKSRVEGTAFINLVSLKLTAGTANETDFVPQATAYANAVNALHVLIYPPLSVETVVGTDDLLAGIIDGLTKAGIALYNNAQNIKVETVKRVTDDLNAKGKLLSWDGYMKELKVIK
jgi:hypothetical protein